MATAGRKPVPAERKRLLGNPGKRPIAEPLTVIHGDGAIPPAPRGLASTGKKVWERVWTAGRAWVAEGSDYDLVVMLCQAMDERDEIRKEIKAHGRTFITDTGYMASNPLVSQLRAVDKQITDWLCQLGFTPAERTRLALGEVRKASELESLLAKRQQ